MNTREALKRLKQLGATIEHTSGEVSIKVEGYPTIRTQVQSRRKSACGKVRSLLNKLERRE